MYQSEEKVVELAQNTIKSEVFRIDYPLSSKLKEILVGDVFSDFMKYAYQRYYHEYHTILKEFSVSHEVQEDKRKVLEENVFWWRLFYDISLQLDRNVVEEYISDHYARLSRMPLAISWLRACATVVPKFYLIGYIYDDRIIIVTDILTLETQNVFIYDPLASPPKTDEIVAGTLLPLGGGLSFPVIDFYHFENDARLEILRHIHYYHDIFSEGSTLHEAFIHVFSSMLQIENMIHQDNLHSINIQSRIQ